MTSLRPIARQETDTGDIDLELVEGARRDFNIAGGRAGAELQQIDEHFFAVLECRGFEQRLFFSRMKGQGHAEKIDQF